MMKSKKKADKQKPKMNLHHVWQVEYTVELPDTQRFLLSSGDTLILDVLNISTPGT